MVISRREAHLPHKSVKHLNSKNYDQQELKELQFAELSKLASSISGDPYVCGNSILLATTHRELKKRRSCGLEKQTRVAWKQ